MNAFNGLKPLQDLDAEQSVLGACLLDKDVLSPVLRLLDTGDFHADKHQDVFDAIRALYNRKEPVDLVTTQDELRRQGRLDDVGGLPYLTTLINAVPTTANTEAYAKIVADRAVLRRIQRAARQIVDDCYVAESADEIRVKAVEEIQAAVFGDRNASMLKPLGASLLEFVEQNRNDRDQGKENRNVVPTPFKVQDKRMPLERGTVTVVPSPSSMGKTTWMFQLLIGTARLQEPSIGFSLEMSNRQILQKTWANVARLNTLKVRHLALTDSEWDASILQAAELSGIPVYYGLKRRMRFTDIRLECLAFKARHGKLSLVTIDYWQIIGDRPLRDERKDEMLGRLVEDAKDLAEECDCHVVILAQAKIDSGKPIPSLEDVKESRAIVAAADNILFLTRPLEFGDQKIKLPSADGQTIYDLKCDATDPADSRRRMFHNVMLGIPGKARMGPKDIIPYYIELETGRMGDLATPWPWDNPKGVIRHQKV